MHVVSHPETDQELEYAALWYEQRQPGLGDDFIDAFDQRQQFLGGLEVPLLDAVENARNVAHREPQLSGLTQRNGCGLGAAYACSAAQSFSAGSNSNVVATNRPLTVWPVTLAWRTVVHMPPSAWLSFSRSVILKPSTK